MKTATIPRDLLDKYHQLLREAQARAKAFDSIESERLAARYRDYRYGGTCDD